MDLKTTLLALERELAAGDGETYRRLVTADARIVVPGQSLTKDAALMGSVYVRTADGWRMAFHQQTPLA